MDYIDIGTDLTKFEDYKPSQFDQKGLGSEGQEEWRVLPVIRTRDSGPLDESNFRVATRMLHDAKVNYQNHSFTHWGPGWFEILVVEPTDDGLRVAGEIASSLANYPVLDDHDFSELEHETAYENWVSWQQEEFVGTLQDNLEFSELAADLLLEGDGELYNLVMRTEPEINTDDGGSSYVIDYDAITRDDVAHLLLEIRRNNRK